MAIEQIYAALGFAAIVLCAIGLGIAAIVGFGIYATLKDARVLLRSAGPKVEGLVSEAAEIVGTVRRVSRGLEGGERDVAELVDAVGEAAASLRRLSRGVTQATAIGAAVGPAVAAFVSTMREGGSQLEGGATAEATTDRGAVEEGE